MENYENLYKNALERARVWKEKSGMPADKQGILDDIFPELKESEDERIRKGLINYFNHHKNGINIFYGIKGDDILAWLEKQGEKPQGKTYTFEGKSAFEAISEVKVDNINKIKSKFKVGDWITNGDYTWKIAEVKPLDYILQSQDGNIVDDTISHVDEQFHSFTIQDAKDGDVIACENGRIGIFIKCLNNNLFSSYCFIDNEGWFFGDEGQVHILDTIICGKIYPATKEQCDLLFQKMYEAGYEWDAEKKELKLLITNGDDFFESENCEQKPAEWSEEDEERLSDAIFFVREYQIPTRDKRLLNAAKETEDWLKSLKTRCTWKPSDEQMADLWNMLCECRPADHQLLQDIYYGLKRLREE